MFSCVSVRYCSQCQKYTVYHCHSCRKDLCFHCKEEHIIDLDTLNHHVTLYREKTLFLSKRDVQEVLRLCLTIRQQHEEMIYKIKSETLYKNHLLLARIKSEVKIRHREFRHIHCMLSLKGHRVKELTNEVLIDTINAHRCSTQKKEMMKYITTLLIYEYISEKSLQRPVNFLRFIKENHVPQIEDTPYLTRHGQSSLSQDINMEFLINFLTEIKISEKGKLKAPTNRKSLLKLMPSPVLQKCFKVKGVDGCHHVSCVTPSCIWVSDHSNNLFLAETSSGESIGRVNDPCYSYFGIHTVGNKCELIYIDKVFSVIKLSRDMKKRTTLTENTLPMWNPSKWDPHCVYFSKSTGDLLVGMYRRYPDSAKIIRYDRIGYLTQTIQHTVTGHALFTIPLFITENTNQDVVVSDTGRLVVTDRGGRLRFSYTGPPSGSQFFPRGVCTDTLSHILVCDDNTNTVQMVNKDGQFLMILLTEAHNGMNTPLSLCFDNDAHLLWVGSSDSTVSVYRYINQQFSLTGVSVR